MHTHILSTIRYRDLFDQSCGHDRQREDRLNAKKRSKGFGGSQPKMRFSEIIDDTYLGPFANEEHCCLKAGSIQSMIFSEMDYGPFWMSAEDHLQKKLDVITGKINKSKTKDELAGEMIRLEIKPVGKNKQDYEIRALTLGIDLNKTVDTVELGWVGKPKGILRVLHEQGFINSSKGYRDYTMDGLKDPYMQVREDASLKMMIEQQLDFIDELTLLQHC